VHIQHPGFDERLNAARLCRFNHIESPLRRLDVLAKDGGVRGIFSDWAATVTYYANCMGLK
jgi:hypothetical protein